MWRVEILGEVGGEMYRARIPVPFRWMWMWMWRLRGRGRGRVCRGGEERVEERVEGEGGDVEKEYEKELLRIAAAPTNLWRRPRMARVISGVVVGCEVWWVCVRVCGFGSCWGDLGVEMELGWRLELEREDGGRGGGRGIVYTGHAVRISHPHSGKVIKHLLASVPRAVREIGGERLLFAELCRIY